MRLILASTSPYRRQLLQRLQLPFTCVSPAVEEAQHGAESVESMTARLAEAKARAVAQLHPGAWVIGADQATTLSGRALGKPGDAERAIEQLLWLSGQRVTFYTAVCLIDAEGNERGCMDSTVVQFRTLASDEIIRYVAAEQPFDCAGSFKCEGLGISLFERIDSCDPTALIGLPLIGLCRLLREAGFELP